MRVRTVHSGGGGSDGRPRGFFAACEHETCITCSDAAITARIVELLPGGLARVEAGGIIEEISVELIDAEAGGLVLVHAGVAIGKL